MKRKPLITIISVIAAATAAFSLYMILSTVITGKREQGAFNDLTVLVAQEKEKQAATAGGQQKPGATVASADTDPTPETSAGPEILPEYKAVQELNPDFYGWLSIEGTVIDYPVMATPDTPQYYLHRAFDGSNSESGTPFLDEACHEGCGNLIVYGHHMKNGTMFGTLADYAGKKFWEQHPTIRFDTLYERGEYEVVAAFFGSVVMEGETGFAYYDYTDLTSPERFEEFMAQVRRNALYDTGVTAEYGDELLTLSTCSYHTMDGRFVVVARKK